MFDEAYKAKIVTGTSSEIKLYFSSFEIPAVSLIVA